MTPEDLDGWESDARTRRVKDYPASGRIIALVAALREAQAANTALTPNQSHVLLAQSLEETKTQRDTLAARVQALTAERDELKEEVDRYVFESIPLIAGQRDKAEAELAAANTRIAELEKALSFCVATAKEQIKGAVYDMTEAHEKSTLALTEKFMDTLVSPLIVERDALSARLERVNAVLDEWELCLRDSKRRVGWSGGAILADLRKALLSGDPE